MKITYNLTNNNSVNDIVTPANIADGSANFDIKFSEVEALSAKVVYTNTDANDDTFKLYGSEDGINWFLYPNANTITTTITGLNVSVVSGWLTASYAPKYLRVEFTKGSSTAGTYLILVTTNS